MVNSERNLLTILLVFLQIMLGTHKSIAEELRVSASIKPIHALVAMVMGDTGEPKIIMSDGASPHQFALKPSQRRVMEQSDVIFIIHEGMETGLVKMLSHADAKIFQVATIKGLELLPRRRDDEFFLSATGAGHSHDDHDDHDNHEGHDDHDNHKDDGHEDNHEKHENHDEENKTHNHDDLESHDHDHGPGATVDYHFWLDPLRAREALIPIADVLGEAYPANAQMFKKNAEKAYETLGQLNLDLHQKLVAHQGQQFIVFHDAYQYFEKRYGLKVISSILDHHDGQVTPSRLLRLRHLVEEHQADCIFAEPQYSSRLVNALAKIDNIPVLELDPIGREISPGADLYGVLMHDLADAVTACNP